MKRRTIITSILVIVLCLGLISGSTFALFTSESSVNIAVTSGKVKLTATIKDNPALYSADATLPTGTPVDKIDPSDITGTILPTDAQGTFAGTYYYRDRTDDHSFLNGGTATVGTDGAMTIAKMTPGDKVVAKLLVKNESNVAIKYRLKITAAATDSTKLNSDKILDVLKVRFENKLYNGLKEFSSAWIAKDAITTAKTYESTVEIILPLDVAEDVYQDNDVKLTFTVEAVQGNAKTIDIVTAATTSVVTKVPNTDNTTAKLVVPTAPLAEDNTNTEVVLTNVGTTNQTVKLTVETIEYDTSSTPTKYDVLEDEQTAVASVDLKLLVDDQAVTAFESGASAKITTYVIKGLNDIKVVYNGTGDVAFGKYSTTDPVRVMTSEGDVDEVGEYYYNPTTGKLVFVTNHFSEYVPATEDVLEAINVTTNTVYKSFATAISSASADDEIHLLKDITLNAVVQLFKNVTIDGQNHEIKNSANRIFRVSASNLDVKMYDLTMTSTCTVDDDERGISFDAASAGSSLLLDRCNISAEFYVINAVPGADNLNITVKNGTVAAGWAAFNLYSNNSTINVVNSTLRGLNDKDESEWNNFNTITLDGNCLHSDKANVGTYGSHNVVNITKSTIFAGSNSDNTQYWIGIQYGAIDNSIVVDSETRIIDSNEDDVSELIYIGYYCNYNNGDWQFYENNSTIKIGDKTVSRVVELDGDGNLVDVNYNIE